jgi:hypothetical protein
MTYAYDHNFMAYTASSSEYAARKIVPLIQEIVPVQSILDVGCAAGTWLRIWHSYGASETHGIDGDWVSSDTLEVPQRCFTTVDLSRPVDLRRKFDFVQSLEVGEHIKPQASADFVASIVRHASGLIAFSAAVPGQGGEHHVNEQPPEFWRGLFRTHGYYAFDFVRPRVQHDRRISFWYRFNVLIYVHESRIAELPEAVRRTHIPDGAPVPDVSPPLFRARKIIVQLLPYRLLHELARIKARIG